MRALWSARVSTSPNVSMTMRSTSREQVSSRHAWRTSEAAAGVWPCAISARASANLPLAVSGLLPEEIRDHRGAALLVPQRAFGAAADHGGVRPARIVGAEGREAVEARVVLLAAHDAPFDQLAGERIADGFFQRGGVGGLAAADEVERLLDQRDVGGRRRGWSRRRRTAPPARCGAGGGQGRRGTACRGSAAGSARSWPTGRAGRIGRPARAGLVAFAGPPVLSVERRRRRMSGAAVGLAPLGFAAADFYLKAGLAASFVRGRLANSAGAAR